MCQSNTVHFGSNYSDIRRILEKETLKLTLWFRKRIDESIGRYMNHIDNLPIPFL